MILLDTNILSKLLHPASAPVIGELMVRLGKTPIASNGWKMMDSRTT